MPDITAILTNLQPVLIVIGWALAAYTVLLWAASVLWTYRDIHSRSEDVVVQVLAVSLALLLPFAGRCAAYDPAATPHALREV